MEIINKETFYYLLNNSIKMTVEGHEDSIFYCYNKDIERQVKYNRLFEINKKYNKELNVKDIMFEVYVKDNIKIFIISAENVWDQVEHSILDVLTQIEIWLNGDPNFNGYRTDFCSFDDSIEIDSYKLL